jgi:hypothetical protein
VKFRAKDKTYMQQDFQENSEISVQYIAQDTVQPDVYTVQELVQILNVTRRTVFNYSKIICGLWHWLPESSFKPSFGKYSKRALDEMRLLKQLGTEEYSRKVNSQQQPIEFSKADVAIVADNIALNIYETKVLQQQSISIAETNQAIEELKLLRKEWDIKNNRFSLAKSTARDARLTRLKAKAMKQALEDFGIMQEIYNSTIQQLEIEQLGE